MPYSPSFSKNPIGVYDMSIGKYFFLLMVSTPVTISVLAYIAYFRQDMPLNTVLIASVTTFFLAEIMALFFYYYARKHEGVKDKEKQ